MILFPANASRHMHAVDQSSCGEKNGRTAKANPSLRASIKSKYALPISLKYMPQITKLGKTRPK